MKGSRVLTGGAAPVLDGTARRAPGGSRNLVLALLIMLGGMIGSFPMAATPVAAGEIGTVIADGAPLLAGVDDHTVIDYMTYGTPVDILYGPHNGMYEIYYLGVHGWTWADKIEVGGVVADGSGEWVDEAPEGEPAASSVSYWGEASWVVVNTDFLNVRADAGTWADVWDVYPGGTWVAVVGDSVNGFAPISYGDGVAWIAEQYISWDGTVSYDAGTSAAAPAGTGGATSGAEHWIDVNRSTGAVTLYIGDVPQATFWGSLGYDTSADGFYSTAVGTWYVTRKYKELAYTTYADAYITDWVAFDESRDNGFHSYMKDQYGNILPWGAGATGGCVGLGPGAAEAVFDFAYVGMRVEVHF